MAPTIATGRSIISPVLLLGFAFLAASPMNSEAQLLKRLKEKVRAAGELTAEQLLATALRCMSHDEACIEKAKAENKPVVLTDSAGSVLLKENGEPVTDPAELPSAQKATSPEGAGVSRPQDGQFSASISAVIRREQHGLTTVDRVYPGITYSGTALVIVHKEIGSLVDLTLCPGDSGPNANFMMNWPASEIPGEAPLGRDVVPAWMGYPNIGGTEIPPRIGMMRVDSLADGYAVGTLSIHFGVKSRFMHFDPQQTVPDTIRFDVAFRAKTMSGTNGERAEIVRTVCYGNGSS